METGQIFKVDEQAVTETATFYKVPTKKLESLVGVEFSIAKSRDVESVTDSEVRASKWLNGKPARGRPRKFPRATVARLLGENDDPSLTDATVVATEQTADDSVDETRAAALLSSEDTPW